jgi:hypothetical protein
MPLSLHPFHRKKQSVSLRALKHVHAELNFRLTHLRKFLTSIETKQVLPLPWIDVDEGGGPREIARKIRSAWIIPPGPVENLTALAERAGIIVVWCEFGARRRKNDGAGFAAMRLLEPLSTGRPLKSVVGP